MPAGGAGGDRPVVLAGLSHLRGSRSLELLVFRMLLGNSLQSSARTFGLAMMPDDFLKSASITFGNSAAVGRPGSKPDAASSRCTSADCAALAVDRLPATPSHWGLANPPFAVSRAPPKPLKLRRREEIA